MVDIPNEDFETPPVAEPEPEPQTLEVKIASVAEEVAAGVWGKGRERTEKLRRAGYNPAVVEIAARNLLRES